MNLSMFASIAFILHFAIVDFSGKSQISAIPVLPVEGENRGTGENSDENWNANDEMTTLSTLENASSAALLLPSKTKYADDSAQYGQYRRFRRWANIRLFKSGGERGGRRRLNGWGAQIRVQSLPGDDFEDDSEALLGRKPQSCGRNGCRCSSCPGFYNCNDASACTG